MLNRFASRRARAVVLTAIGLTVLIGGVVVAQTQPLPAVQWDNRRLDQLDRNVRRLERALTQRNAAGQPVLVEPDPEVIALQGQVGIMDRRLRDLEATVQRVNGDLERTTFQLDERQRDAEALSRRLRDAEGRVQALETVAQRVEAQREEERLAAEADASPTGSAAGDLAAARALAGAEAGDAYQRLIENWPEAAEAREAEWRLGDLSRAGGDQAAAAGAYARALRGWPTTAWAGEVTIKLARALGATRRQEDGCAALSEFDRRYAARASADLRTVATRVRGELRCG